MRDNNNVYIKQEAVGINLWPDLSSYDETLVQNKDLNDNPAVTINLL